MVDHSTPPAEPSDPRAAWEARRLRDELQDAREEIARLRRTSHAGDVRAARNRRLVHDVGQGFKLLVVAAAVHAAVTRDLDVPGWILAFLIAGLALGSWVEGLRRGRRRPTRVLRRTPPDRRPT